MRCNGTRAARVPFTQKSRFAILNTAGDDRVRQADLVIVLQRASLYGQRTRGSSRLRSLVDDPHGDAEPGQPEREYEPRGPGTDNQDKRAGHLSVFSCIHKMRD